MSQPLHDARAELASGTFVPSAPVRGPFSTVTPHKVERVKRLLREKLHRECEAVRLYEPMPEQLAFHRSMALRRIVMGGNRGGKAQPVDEPVLTPDGWRRIGDLKPGDVVIGGDGLPCIVRGVFPQGRKPIFEVQFGDGASTRCCEEHLWRVQTRRNRFRNARGQWQVLSLKDIRSQWGDEPVAIQRPVIPTCVPWMPRRQTLIEPYLLGVLLGDGHFGKASVMLTSADEEIVGSVAADLPAGMLLQKKPKRPDQAVYDYAVKSARPKANQLLATLRLMGLSEKKSYEKFVPREYLFNSADVRLAVLQGLMDTDGTVGLHSRTRKGEYRTVSFSTTSPQLAKDVMFLVRSLGGRCSSGEWHEKKFRYRGEIRTGRASVNLFIHMTADCPFRLQRKAKIWAEWKKTNPKDTPRVMRKVVPAGEAECVCISVSSPDQTYVTKDLIVTHNTVSTMMDLAWAVRGLHPYLTFPKKDGRAWVVAKSNKQIGEVLYRKLFRAGAFKIIKDRKTGLWRAYKPLDPDDLAREKEAKPAPPLIPPRAIKDFAWENKKLSVPAKVILHNGWEISFFTSGSPPTQGADIDICLAGWSEIYDPVEQRHRRIDEIDGPFHVLSLTEETGRIETRRASRPFVKGFGEIVEITLSNGERIFTTRRHQVRATDGRYVSVQEAFLWRIPLAAARASAFEYGSLEASRRSLPARPQTSAKAPAANIANKARQVDLAAAPGTDAFYGDDELLRALSESEHHDPQESYEPHRKTGRTCARYPGGLSTNKVAQVLASSFSEATRPSWQIPPVRSGREFQSRHHGQHARRYPTRRRTSQLFPQPPSRHRALRVLDATWRAVSSLAIRLVYALWCGPVSGAIQGFRSNYSDDFRLCGERLRWGAIGDRARAPSRHDAQIYDRSSTRLDGLASRAEHSRPSEYDGPSVSDLVLSLCEPFDHPVFVERIEVIGDFAIWDISVPGTLNYVNGGVINHNCLFDEEVEHPEWLPEMLMRLVDRHGRFIWGATPQSGTEQFIMLGEEADKEKAAIATGPPRPPMIEKFSLPFWDNKFLGQREKNTIINDPTLTEEDRRVRLDGQPAALRYLMFPEFSRDRHCVESVEPKPDWLVEPYSYLPRGEIPKDWCRYLVIDPGSVTCAVLFAAVPPGSVGDYVYLYDELYIKDCSAQKLAEEVKRKTEHDFFEAFIIDYHGSARSEHATGLTVKRAYYNAFKAAGIKSRQTGHSFIDGCDDVQARCDMVRDWLRVRPDGTVKLRVVREKMPNWLEEMKRYKRQRKLDPRTGMKEIIDKPDDSRNAHLMATTQYLAAFQPVYREPPRQKGPQTWAQRRLEERRKKRKKGTRDFINLGP